MKPKYFYGSIALVFLAVGVFFGVSFFNLENKHETLLQNFETMRSSTTERIGALERKLANTSEQLNKEQKENEDLKEALERERERNEAFEEQIEDITGTVGKLDKLSKTDPELLQKYSRVYFLNEHYQPENLEEIEKKYLYSDDELEFLHADVMPFFEDMMDDARRDDIDISVVSGFRSFDEQADLKGKYLVSYGSGSNSFSADQGYSEHQLGTTVDFSTEDLGGNLEGFETTPAYKWLTKNAHEYGFVLSYPEDNAFYVFEPWHWRFVGEELAEDLDRKGEHFYDWEQRKIDEYLISIFD